MAGPGIARLRLAPARGESLPNKPGQFVTLHPHGHEERDYSLACGPDDEMLELHIKAGTADGTSAYLINDLTPETDIPISGPYGSAIYDAETMRHAPLILMAGGLGASPMRAIALAALADSGRTAPVTFYWGVREESHFYMREEWEALAAKEPRFSFIKVIETPVIEHVLQNSHLTDAYIFMAGPQSMTDDALPKLLKAGAERAHIYFDQWESSKP